MEVKTFLLYLAKHWQGIKTRLQGSPKKTVLSALIPLQSEGTSFKLTQYSTNAPVVSLWHQVPGEGVKEKGTLGLLQDMSFSLANVLCDHASCPSSWERHITIIIYYYLL